MFKRNFRQKHVEKVDKKNSRTCAKLIPRFASLEQTVRGWRMAKMQKSTGTQPSRPRARRKERECAADFERG